MSYFQSQTMVFCEAIMPRQQAWQIMDMLGRMNCVHIVRPSIPPASFENPFSLNLKRCQQILVKIKHIRLFIEQFSTRKLTESTDLKKAFAEFDEMLDQRNVLGHLFLSEAEEEINKVENFLVRQKKEYDGIREARKRMILEAALLMTLAKNTNIAGLQRQELRQQSILEEKPEQVRRSSISKLEYKCGLIARKDQMLLKRVIFRISHGNAWVQTFEIQRQQLVSIFKSPRDTQCVDEKLVFIIVFQTGEHNVAEQKINRVLNGLDCYVDSRRMDSNNLRDFIQQLERRKEEHDNLAEITKEGIANYLDHLYEPRRGSHCSYLCFLELYTKKEKFIYEALAACTTANNFLLFNTFVPQSKLEDLKALKTRKSDMPSLVLSAKEPPFSPPTLFPTCEMMEIPQQIVNTYGVPSYKQFNPATLYLVTFGFFVGVMFGDVGHMLLGVGAMIYLQPNKWWWTIIFWMGYCGLIYNEFFGLNFGLFSSCYNVTEAGQAELQNNECVCVFGLDPVWKIANNRMAFTNSYKMKLAVILGVVHMTVGILLRGVNSIRKKAYLDLFAVALPQLLFMVVTFVYMDFLIIFKWLKFFPDTSQAPSIINIMISMIVGNKGNNTVYLYEREKAVEKACLVIAIIIIPILLLVKPLVIRLKTKSVVSHQVRGSEGEVLNQDNNMVISDQLANDLRRLGQFNHDAQNDEHGDIGELFIHQLIETIEFVLGSVSNTASYLRLWALSLAHTQLAEVFFQMLLKKPLINGYAGIFSLIVVFVFFISVTFGVLFCMDVMECFLHSLRLHWVEFQNKFFVGAGRQFKAYSFEASIKALQ